ncbi:hypothetical protein SUGI_0391710 [Cryptomeria japonica]|nr:hypothetical protein SUGI_0391710 [Cryptomeria japonica]
MYQPKLMELSSSREEEGIINVAVLQGPPSVVAEIITDPFSKEYFGSILEHSKGGGRSKGFLSQPLVLPEENIPSISNKTPHTMG